MNLTQNRVENNFSFISMWGMGVSADELFPRYPTKDWLSAKGLRRNGEEVGGRGRGGRSAGCSDTTRARAGGADLDRRGASPDPSSPSRNMHRSNGEGGSVLGGGGGCVCVYRQQVIGEN